MANSVWVGCGDSTVFHGSVTAPSLIADTLTLDIANQDIQLSRSATRALTLGPTTGVTLRWATDGLLEVRNVANDAAGSVNLLNLTATGIVTAPSMYGVSSLLLGFAAQPYWQLDTSAHLVPITHNTRNLGTDTTRPAIVYAGTSVVSPSYTVGTTVGASFDGPITNLTVVNGIVTAAS